MSARTIAGDIRRLRKLLVPNSGLAALPDQKAYGEFLQILDAIETKARCMQNALNIMRACVDSTCGEMGVCRTCAVMRNMSEDAGGAE